LSIVDVELIREKGQILSDEVTSLVSRGSLLALHVVVVEVPVEACLALLFEHREEIEEMISNSNPQ
jgi:hypothetical protein